MQSFMVILYNLNSPVMFQGLSASTSIQQYVFARVNCLGLCTSLAYKLCVYLDTEGKILGSAENVANSAIWHCL